MIIQAVIYFLSSFVVLNLWLMSQLRGIRNSNDEPKKGRVVLKGLVAHFALSILIIIVYYRFVYAESIPEVLIAMAFYSISFGHYVITASRIK